MAKKNPGGKKKLEPKKWSMRPQLHAEVMSLLLEDDVQYAFHTQDTYNGTVNAYDTNVMGYFPCYNPQCPVKGWPSKHIAISIREFPKQRYNARVYHQKCEECRHVSKPKLNASYAERVAYRIKFWQGIEQEKPPYNGNNTRRPHKKDLCEGCKAGRCIESQRLRHLRG
ncbi:zinc-binding domain-containing protein [Sarocladium implicatum]|nr:zinc-binding domain-containing protein [Sarocladium implicatum]